MPNAYAYDERLLFGERKNVFCFENIKNSLINKRSKDSVFEMDKLS